MLKPRKRLVKAKLKEDKLLIFTARVRNLASRYQRQLLYGLAAVVVILVVGIAMSLSKTAAERNAAFEMLLARDAYAMGDLDKTLVHTKTVLEDYTGTRAAAEALMLEARVSEQGGDYEKAIELYERLLSKHGEEKYLAFGACLALGAIYYGQAEYNEAARCYLEGAERYPHHFNAAEGLLEAGKCLKKAGRYRESERILRKALTDYPKATVAGQVREELEEIVFMP